MSAKPNPKRTAMATFRGRRERRERLLKFYLVAFRTLAERHVCVPDALYETDADREWESADTLAHHALMLAICANAQWEAFAKRNP